MTNFCAYFTVSEINYPLIICGNMLTTVCLASWPDNLVADLFGGEKCTSPPI